MYVSPIGSYSIFAQELLHLLYSNRYNPAITPTTPQVPGDMFADPSIDLNPDIPTTSDLIPSEEPTTGGPGLVQQMLIALQEVQTRLMGLLPGGGDGTPLTLTPSNTTDPNGTTQQPPATTYTTPTDPTGGIPSGDVPNSGKGAIKAVFDGLKTRYGLTDAQAAGILGNFMQESGVRSDINQGGKTGAPEPGGSGYGLAQWSGARKKQFLDYAKQTGQDPTSMKTQMGFLFKELDGPYKSTIDAVKKATTPAEASVAFEKLYEGDQDPVGTQQDQRNKFAEEIYKMMQGLQ